MKTQILNKATYLAILLVTFTFLLSCGDDDSPSPTPTNQAPSTFNL